MRLRMRSTPAASSSSPFSAGHVWTLPGTTQPVAAARIRLLSTRKYSVTQGGGTIRPWEPLLSPFQHCTRAAEPGTVLGSLGPNGAGDRLLSGRWSCCCGPDRGRAMAGGLTRRCGTPRVRRMIRAWLAAASPCCRPPSTWRRRTCSRTISRLSTMGRSSPTAPADLKRVISEQAVVVQLAHSRPEAPAGLPFALCRIGGTRVAVGDEYMVSKHRGGVRRRPGSGSPEEREADEVCITSARADGRPGRNRNTTGNAPPESR